MPGLPAEQPPPPVVHASNLVAPSAPPAPNGRPGARSDAAITTGSTTQARDSARAPEPRAATAPRSPAAPEQPAPNAPRQTLQEVLERAIANHPQIELAQFRAEESRQGINVAAAAARPQLDLRANAGHSTLGAGYNEEGFLTRTRSLNGNMRVDGGISLRQLIYDFGATSNDFARNQRQFDARRLETFDKVEEIGLRVVNAYMRIVEAREIVAAADENIAALRRIANLVRQNERNGNGTMADVRRVEVRMTDAEAQRTDLAADLQNAVDQFRRLAKQEPGLLQPVVSPNAALPRSPAEAIGLANSRHPRLLAVEQNQRAIAHEFESQRAQGRPRITADVDAQLRNFIGPDPRTEVDVRAMLSLRYRIGDGGLNRALEEQIIARAHQNRARFRDTREEIEADIRQFYRAIDAARAKFSTLQESRDNSARVVELYTEQFRGGKRTLFELLDAQTAFTTARRAVISNQFEERRAIYGVLRSTGRLTPTIMAARADNPAPARAARR